MLKEYYSNNRKLIPCPRLASCKIKDIARQDVKVKKIIRMNFDSPNSFVFLSLPVIIYSESIPLLILHQRLSDGAKFSSWYMVGSWLVHDINSACLRYDLHFTRVYMKN